jgi:hypothetical protein
MSLPTEIDFALIKIGDGASPEVFSVICGLTDVTHSETVGTSDRFVRDCAKPGEVPSRKTRATGKQLDVSGSGLTNVDMIPDLQDALGKVLTYRVEFYADDGTDAGDLLGTTTGAFRMTANNLNIPREGDATGEISLASHGDWTYAAAA